jgi:hypothetical protein
MRPAAVNVTTPLEDMDETDKDRINTEILDRHSSEKSRRN